MSTLKPWRQVVTPHADIRQGRFDASVFAADLGEVLANRGAVDYRDPATFFGKTFLTRTLSDLLKEVMGRLAGSGKAEPVKLDYDMEKTARGWKVWDVRIADISLTANYRTEFANVMRSSGIDGLITTLHNKNAGLDRAQPAASADKKK